MKISASDWGRKAVHAGMGLCALALRWLTWPQAAALALAALLFSLYAMPHIGRGIYRDARERRDAGIVAYPAMVLLLLLLFRNNIYIVAAVWAMMAFGDSAAAIVGRLVEGPRLPWNPQKTWVGLLAGWAMGGVSAFLVAGFVAGRFEPAAVVLLMAGAALYAFLETVRSGVDDNWVAPIPTALVLFQLGSGWSAAGFSGAPVAPALAVNAAVAWTTWRFGLVAASGAWTGALFGFVIAALGGWGSYAVLWSFFLLGTVATKWGYRRKSQQQMAEADRGRRRAAHVVANVGVPVVLLLVGARPVAFVAAFAAALADTLGTEIGGLYAREPYSFIRRRAVPAGTPGAVSLPGICAGFFGAAAVGAVGAMVKLIPTSFVLVVAVAGVIGSLAESLVLDAGREQGVRLDHDFANALNTLVGAMAALEIILSIEGRTLFLPIVGP